ncbi:MAG TPA: hypothetical protein VFF06_06970 [Polyangia bacterium]|nr:hypothetical protein [Polyangia bacterium]
MLAALIAALADGDRRCMLAERGRYCVGAGEEEVCAAVAALGAEAFVAALQYNSGALVRAWRIAGAGRAWPGRSEALLAIARALGCALPESEYRLPEDGLEALLERARRSHGQRVPVRGARRHKGRVGDGVERLLIGGKAPGRAADHAAAEIKSVPVRGDQVIERVKLGVVSARSNPLSKCARVLFVFVEQRGGDDRDHFVRGHHLAEFDHARFQAMWRDGFLVETAAGSPKHPARGLYLTPRWFREQHIWPG